MEGGQVSQSWCICVVMKNSWDSKYMSECFFNNQYPPVPTSICDNYNSILIYNTLISRVSSNSRILLSNDPIPL